MPTLKADSLALKNRLALRNSAIEPAAYDGSIQSFGEAMLAATWARHLLTKGNIEAAKELAKRILDIANLRKYTAPAVWSLAILGDVGRAHAVIASCNDRVLSYDALESRPAKAPAANVALLHGLAAMAARAGLVA
jgi:hypothetical protein